MCRHSAGVFSPYPSLSAPVTGADIEPKFSEESSGSCELGVPTEDAFILLVLFHLLSTFCCRVSSPTKTVALWLCFPTNVSLTF